MIKAQVDQCKCDPNKLGCGHFLNAWSYNGEASYVTIMLDGYTYPGQKLVQFILFLKTYKAGKTRPLKPGKDAGFW
jgi:hypothetical protein